MIYQAVIFDLDGTLVNTLADIAVSANHAMAQLSLPTHPIESFRQKIGHGIRHMVSCCMPQGCDDMLEEAVTLQMEYYTNNLYVHSELYPGVNELLGELKQLPLKLAVLSNKKESFTRQITDHFFQKNLFDHVAGGRSDIPLKPDPASALKLSQRLAIPTDKIAYLGDSAVDMQTAHRAGMLAVGATWGFRDRQELLDNGANVLIDHPLDLLAVLENDPS